MELLTLILLGIIIALLILVFFIYKFGVKQGRSQTDLKWQENLVSIRNDIANKQRAGIKGKVTEAFAPFLKGFPFKASECKFLGDPVDYLVFEGLDERDVKKIHFIEIKDNSSKLSKHQKQIKDLINSLDSDEVTFKEFRFNSNTDELGFEKEI